MDSLNILMIGGLAPWHPEAGGGQIIAYKLAEALAKKGQNITYVAICPKEYQNKLDWCEVAYLDKINFFSQFSKSLSERTERYDLVHLHAANEIPGFCLGYTLRKTLKDYKLVIQIYTALARGLPRSLFEACCIISSHMADAVFSLSDFSKKNVSEAYHVPQSKIKVTYAGVDETFFKERNRNATNEQFNLLFCGRIAGPRRQKGIDILLRAMYFILKENDVKLKLIGTGSRVEEYKALSHELGIGEHVEFLGFVDYDNLPEYYSNADLFVLPSRRESFGLVLAEAMAAGLPVVSTNIGAIPEVVVDGKTGILVPPDEPKIFANAVNSLLSDSQRREVMGMKGRERVKKYFTWEKVAERVLRFYEEIL